MINLSDDKIMKKQHKHIHKARTHANDIPAGCVQRWAYHLSASFLKQSCISHILNAKLYPWSRCSHIPFSFPPHLHDQSDSKPCHFQKFLSGSNLWPDEEFALTSCHTGIIRAPEPCCSFLLTTPFAPMRTLLKLTSCYPDTEQRGSH